MGLALKVWVKTQKIKENAVSFHDVIDNKDGYKGQRLPVQNRKSLKLLGLIQCRI